MATLKMQYVLKGFTQVEQSRVFVFEGVGADHARSVFTVQSDLNLTRQYGIRLQELPLLCRALLERTTEGEPKRTFTYTEADMRAYADGAREREEAARSRRAPRRPVTEQPLGSAWRMPLRSV